MNPKSGTSRTVVAPTESDEAQEATTDQPGKNKRYSGDGQLVEAQPAEEAKGHEFEPVEEPVEQTSWIEIELIDELDQPVPGAFYEITAPDGKIHDGTTDADGCARIEPIAPGTCQISFPKLDAEAWERI